MTNGNNGKRLTELSRPRPRKVQEKFSFVFSQTQISAVSLIILAATFLVQGIIRYFEFFDKMQFIKPWFMLIVFALIFLVFSVIAISFENIFSPLRYKRTANIIGFTSFIVGFMLFLTSLIFLIFVI